MKKNFIDVKDDFVASLNRQKKLTAIIIAVIVALIISLFIIVPRVQANIRSSELKSLVSQEKLTEKAAYLDVQAADKEITEKTAMTVLFSVPSGKIYNQVIKVLKDSKKIKEFNHSIFVYPIVYDPASIEEKYAVKRDDVTIIFFENGKEKNRIPIDASFDVNTLLIPALNQLPMTSLEQVQPPASSVIEPTEPTDSAETTESIAVDEQSAAVEPVAE